MNSNNKSLRGQVVSITKKQTVSAVVIDIVGSRCAVRLSGRGGALTNLPFSGKKPSKGDNVFVDYSRGVPIVITSDSGDSSGTVTSITSSSSAPVIVAQTAEKVSSVESTDSKRYGNLLYREEWSGTTQYLKNDLVRYGDKYFLCVSDLTIGGSTQDESWLMFSDSTYLSSFAEINSITDFPAGQAAFAIDELKNAIFDGRIWQWAGVFVQREQPEITNIGALWFDTTLMNVVGLDFSSSDNSQYLGAI